MTQRDIVHEFLLRKVDALARADKAFFEQTLHSDFVYVNTRGVRLDRAGYIARISATADFRFVSQEISDLMVTTIGELAIATMSLRDTFAKGAQNIRVQIAMRLPRRAGVVSMDCRPDDAA